MANDNQSNNKRAHPKGTEILVVPGDADDGGVPLSRAIKARYPELSWGRIRKMCAAGRVLVGGNIALDGRRALAPGTEVTLLPEGHKAQSEPFVGVVVRFQDRHIAVVEKPSGISTVPFDDNESDTLVSRLRRTWAKKGIPGSEGPLLTVQRLDKETSGVVVFARSELARKKLSHDLRKRRVERSYLAVVHGVIKEDRGTYRSFLGNPRGGIRRMSVKGGGASGKEAITHFEVLERYHGATLLRCRLETGRTHQIRIHLSEAGHPIVGERVYLRGYSGPELHFSRLALHAHTLGFTHPVTHRHMSFNSRLSPEIEAFIRGMGSQLEPQKPVNAPDWARKNKGGKRIKTLGQLLDHAAAAPDWDDSGRALSSRKAARVAVDDDGWMHLERGPERGKTASPGPQRPKSERQGAAAMPKGRRVRVSRPPKGPKKK